MDAEIVLSGGGSALDLAIMAWLDAKTNRSGSKKTATAYHTVLTSFRTWLRGQGLDLDSNPRVITLLAQAWVGQRNLKPASYNQHLAILSSFYTFARKQQLLTTENPIEPIERAKVQAYAGALPLEPAHIRERFKAIDRSTPAGARDYALLALALQTGRRLSELANLRLGDIERSGTQVIVHWRRTKGGKQMHDALPVALSNALLHCLRLEHGPDLRGLPSDTPVWVSFSGNSRGKPLSIRSIANICEARLGVSTVHSLRHTFARSMEDAGAKVSDIQARLGHESLDTTGRYLAALRRADNPQADALATLFGLDT